MKVSRNDFQHNQGTTLLVEEITGKTDIVVENNQFQHNRFQKNTALSSAVKLGTSGNSSEIQICLYGNLIHRNVMEIILQIGRTVQKNTPIDVKVAVVGNSFLENLALDTAYLATNNAKISYNSFNNAEARCELRTGLKISQAQINATNNYWGSSKHDKVMDRICDSHKNQSLIPVEVMPFLSAAPEQLFTNVKQLGNLLSKVYDFSGFLVRK
ncbi:unnamed protein product [Gongylonema pulchrum]|uniref:Uncharacterized protein n=1 Tax=Gongylonema pulchrum TaxID=637853 RepID=A0A183D591_9BILA|nr:unnamed protein product [Gongylonema pulchrum]